ncbi:hypothetical protein FRB90_000607 [Tulasnella sp. 427]|nr:hypothetical protein FRB90_000607 [Tulasnella sp. 427]
MPKRLELKETKAEILEKEHKRLRKEARKAARYHVDDPSSSTASHASRTAERSSSSRNFGRGSRKHYDYVFEDLDDPRWMPSSSSTKVDEDSIRAQMEEDEEQAFRDKLFDAMEMDFGQDSAYNHFNSYAHVPPQWRKSSPTASRDAEGPPNPNYMDDEQYAEYVREGMWERTHKAEVEERQRRKERAKERKEKEKRLREESKKLEAEALEERRRRREEKDKRKIVESWMAYESRWSTLQRASASSKIVPNSLDFQFLPWPVHPPPKSIEALTKESISSFVLSDLHSAEKTKKQRLRNALLLYHPDRFESKFMAFVKEEDHTLVKEAVGRVVRVLNALTEDGTETAGGGG